MEKSTENQDVVVPLANTSIASVYARKQEQKKKKGKRRAAMKKGCGISCGFLTRLPLE